MKEYMKKTLNYYENNAQEYANNWTDDFLSNYDFTVPDIFLSYLDANANILDLGCGTGRDSKYFLDKGYNVTAIDGSQEFCKMASKHLNLPVTNINFLDMNYTDEFDGVFACASLLHLNDTDLPIVLEKLYKSLKENGILYCSFKKGEASRIDDNSRFYNDMTEEKFTKIINNLNGKFHLLKTWESNQYKSSTKFINFILRREKYD